jgi:hypothetical protein
MHTKINSYANIYTYLDPCSLQLRPQTSKHDDGICYQSVPFDGTQGLFDDDDDVYLE